jgi:hypothetical protein
MKNFKDIREACWKGYKKKGMKTMFGKRYPNCVKEDGSAGPTVVTGPQSATDPVSATAVKLPMKKKKYPTLTRTPPKM